MVTCSRIQIPTLICRTIRRRSNHNRYIVLIPIIQRRRSSSLTTLKRDIKPVITDLSSVAKLTT
ncbi:hypothetical protein PVL29_021240 [Vitis rotundifolia]|uniref:Uncharacterized protein n=1 Tax=Vitis rotundifolia TaxID=103349 RepID=A0AA38YZ01_VITRO|nr:hypothetical protein PVL29_021240 [Vitis rotundifolia]